MTHPAPTGLEIDGAKLRDLRQLAGFTITGFAPKCGVSLGYLSHIERGVRRTVSPPVFIRICDALGISAEDRRTMLRPKASV
ncbi:MAG: helix-turn-helix transcriptional regulator [Actinoplanes sp.]